MQSTDEVDPVLPCASLRLYERTRNLYGFFIFSVFQSMMSPLGGSMAVFAFAAVAISMTFLLSSLRGFTRDVGPLNRFAGRLHTLRSPSMQIIPSLHSTHG